MEEVKFLYQVELDADCFKQHGKSVEDIKSWDVNNGRVFFVNRRDELDMSCLFLHLWDVEEFIKNAGMDQIRCRFDPDRKIFCPGGCLKMQNRLIFIYSFI